jgi:hypothetical protein
MFSQDANTSSADYALFVVDVDAWPVVIRPLLTPTFEAAAVWSHILSNYSARVASNFMYENGAPLMQLNSPYYLISIFQSLYKEARG